MIRKHDEKASAGIAVCLGERRWTAASASQPHQAVRPRGKRVLPAILLPRVSGEPLRLDDHYPPHPRGTGESWPPEALVSEAGGCGRFPLAAAWAGLRDSKSWQWCHDDRTVRVTPEDALGTATAAIARRYQQTEAALVVPNWLRQRQKQAIIDAGRRTHGVRIVLLWQPIAAALAYLDRHSCEPLDAGSHLLHVHCGWDEVHFTRLELVHEEKDGQVRCLPARHRPNAEDSHPSCGWAILDCWRRGLQPRSSANMSWWKLFVGEDCGIEMDSTVTSLKQLGHQSHVDAIGGQDWRIPQATLPEIRRWLLDRCNSTEHGAAAVVITGDLADLIVGEEAEQLADITGLSTKSVSLANGSVGEELMTCGAALFLDRRSRGQPTYLDTLPRIELLVETGGVHNWIALMEEQQRYVDGGVAWNRPHPVSNLSVPRGASSLKLAVSHEEYDSVRELEAILPRSAPKGLPAELTVSATPAEGHAVLEVRILDTTYDARSRIVANWRRMRDTGMKKDDYVASQPKAFPELMPRKASWRLWPQTRIQLERVTSYLERGRPVREWVWTELRGRLQQKDQSFYPFDATVFDSEGSIVDKTENVHRYASALWTYLKSPSCKHSSNVVRCLGYMSANLPEFESWLISRLDYSFGSDGGAVLHACGHCLRDPENTAALFRWILRRCDQRVRTNDIKTLSQALRYRHNATQNLRSAEAEKLVLVNLMAFEQDLQGGGRSFLFRWSALSVVFLLRHRRFDTNFLDP